MIIGTFYISMMMKCVCRGKGPGYHVEVSFSAGACTCKRNNFVLVYPLVILDFISVYATIFFFLSVCMYVCIY